MIDDDVVGVAIDMADIEPILFKWFGGSYNDIINWKEKARKWDDLATPIDKRSLEDQKIVEEKIWKYDEWQKYLNVRGYKYIDDVLEKAKKWDDYMNLKTTRHRYITQIEEKAQKWENIMSVYGLKPDFDLNPRKIDEYIEKARKWDEIDHVRLDAKDELSNNQKALVHDKLLKELELWYINPEYIKEWKEKARRYDEIKGWYETSFKKWEG